MNNFLAFHSQTKQTVRPTNKGKSLSVRQHFVQILSQGFLFLHERRWARMLPGEGRTLPTRWAVNPNVLKSSPQLLINCSALFRILRLQRTLIQPIDLLETNLNVEQILAHEPFPTTHKSWKKNNSTYPSVFSDTWQLITWFYNWSADGAPIYIYNGLMSANGFVSHLSPKREIQLRCVRNAQERSCGPYAASIYNEDFRSKKFVPRRQGSFWWQMMSFAIWRRFWMYLIWMNLV